MVVCPALEPCALDSLAELEPSLAELVDLHFFCGYELREIAGLRNVSERTVQRSWRKARLLLHEVVNDVLLCYRLYYLKNRIGRAEVVKDTSRILKELVNLTHAGRLYLRESVLWSYNITKRLAC